jgi:putative transposase
MPRVARSLPSTGFVHVISRGNNRRKIFRYDRDKKKYLHYLADTRFEDQIDIMHYCIMSNHVHLLVHINEQSDLSRFMQRNNLKFTWYCRTKYDFCGHLWQDRFTGKTIDNEEYLIRCGKYIELNPVRAGVVKKPHEYHFSSYNYYAFGKIDTLIAYNPWYDDLSSDSQQRRRLYRGLMAEDAP